MTMGEKLVKKARKTEEDDLRRRGSLKQQWRNSLKTESGKQWQRIMLGGVLSKTFPPHKR